MAQNINDTTTDDTTIVYDEKLTVGLLKETINDFPDDYEVVFPVMVGETITDNWARVAAILSDDELKLVGIAIS
jgi:hypothetical protein